MKIVVYAMMRLDHQVVRAKEFCQGLKKHGYTNVSVQSHDRPIKCDLAVFWGMHHSKQIQQMQKQNKKDYLLMERGYVGDRFYWTSLGYNGLNGHGEFHNQHSPNDRWNKYFPDIMKPWHDGEYVLITGQVPGDASVKHLNVNYQTIANNVRKHTNLPILFRKHPHRLTKNMPTPKGCITSPAKTVEEALAGAKVCVTANSNSGVDAIIAGTPVINLFKGSMFWNISEHDYSKINNPPHPDREQWRNNIAYAQWSPEEIKDGTAWEHLKQRFKK